MRKARHHDRHARASDRHLEGGTGSKRRARLAKKQAAIGAEAFAPGANVAKIRRHHGLLFSWRRQVKRARPSPVAEATSEGEHANPWGWLPVEVGFGLTERGWAGAEAGVACEAGSGAASRRDDRNRGRAH